MRRSMIADCARVVIRAGLLAALLPSSLPRAWAAELSFQTESTTVRLQKIRQDFLGPLEEQISQLTAEKGDDHPELIPLLHETGKVYREHGAYLAATPLLERALQIAEAAHDEMQILFAHDYLGTLYLLQGAYDSARAEYERALAPTEALLGKESPAYAIGTGHMAAVLFELGHVDEAETLIRESIAVLSRTLGPANHPATSLQALAGRIYFSAGRIREAERTLVYALVVRSEALGLMDEAEAHLYMAPVQNVLGGFYTAIGLFENAEPLITAALSASDTGLDELDPRQEEVLVNAFALYEALGDTERANEYRSRAELVHEANRGFSHRDSMARVQHMPAFRVEIPADGLFAQAKTGDYAEYELGGKPHERLEIGPTTSEIVVVRTLTPDGNGGWHWFDEEVVRRDISLDEFHESGHLQPSQCRLKDREIECFETTWRNESDGTAWFSLFVAPNIVPLGGKLATRQGDEIVSLARYGNDEGAVEVDPSAVFVPDIQ